MTLGSKSSRVSRSDIVESGRATQERIRCCWAGPSTKPADGTARRVSALGAARNLMMAGLTKMCLLDLCWLVSCHAGSNSSCCSAAAGQSSGSSFEASKRKSANAEPFSTLRS